MTITVTAVGQPDGKVLTTASEVGAWQDPSAGVANLGVANKTGTTLDVTSSTGSSATLPAVTAMEAGLMSAAEQVKLAGIEAGAVAAGAAGDAFSTAHLSAFDHTLIGTALQADAIHDAPVEGATTAAISSNWAYDHASGEDPHPQYAPVAEGVTNGDTHAHEGGAGGQIAYSSLGSIPSTFAPADHAHSANKLEQANTHESADTDTGTSSLHHTIGVGANNAAAGNHVHSGIYEPVQTTASQAEMEAGTEAALRSMSPLRVAQAIAALAEGGGGATAIQIAVTNQVSPIVAGAAQITFRMPFAMTLTAIRASVKTAPTGAALVVDVNEGGASVFSTLLSIDAGEKTSTTAATSAVISDSALADDAEITIDVDQIGSTVAGVGLIVTLIGAQG